MAFGTRFRFSLGLGAAGLKAAVWGFGVSGMHRSVLPSSSVPATRSVLYVAAWLGGNLQVQSLHRSFRQTLYKDHHSVVSASSHALRNPQADHRL